MFVKSYRLLLLTLLLTSSHLYALRCPDLSIADILDEIIFEGSYESTNNDGPLWHLLSERNVGVIGEILMTSPVTLTKATQEPIFKGPDNCDDLPPNIIKDIQQNADSIPHIYCSYTVQNSNQEQIFTLFSDIIYISKNTKKELDDLPDADHIPTPNMSQVSRQYMHPFLFPFLVSGYHTNPLRYSLFGPFIHSATEAMKKRVKQDKEAQQIENEDKNDLEESDFEEF